VNVDPESLRRAGRDLDVAVDEVDALVGRLDAQLAGQVPPWGSDDLGFLIGLCFQGAFDLALDSIEANADELSVYAGRLIAMGDSYDGVEADNLGLMQGIHKQLDGSV